MKFDDCQYCQYFGSPKICPVCELGSEFEEADAVAPLDFNDDCGYRDRMFDDD